MCPFRAFRTFFRVSFSFSFSRSALETRVRKPVLRRKIRVTYSRAMRCFDDSSVRPCTGRLWRVRWMLSMYFKIRKLFISSCEFQWTFMFLPDNNIRRVVKINHRVWMLSEIWNRASRIWHVRVGRSLIALSSYGTHSRHLTAIRRRKNYRWQFHQTLFTFIYDFQLWEKFPSNNLTCSCESWGLCRVATKIEWELTCDFGCRRDWIDWKKFEA